MSKPSRAQVAEGALKQLKAELMTKNKTLVSMKHTLEDKNKEIDQIRFSRDLWLKSSNKHKKNVKIWKILFFSMSAVAMTIAYFLGNF